MGFTDWLNIIANIVGIVSFIPIAISAWYIITKLRKKKKRENLALKNYQEGHGCALIITIGSDEKNIYTLVDSFIKNDQNLTKEIGNNKYSIRIHENLTPEKSLDVKRHLMHEIEKIESEIDEKVLGKIHLFYKGPTSLAFAIGAKLSNGYSVILYQYTDGKYIKIGIMDETRE